MDSSSSAPDPTIVAPTPSPVFNSATSASPITPEKTSSGRGKTVGLIIASILAVAGFSFGGYEFYQNTKISGTGTADSNSAGITSFSLEVTNPDGSVAGLETDQFTIENGVLSATYNDPTVTLTITPEGSTPVSSDYIYIGQWGIKVRKPEAKHVAFECEMWSKGGCRILASNKDEIFLNHTTESNGYDYVLEIARTEKGTASTGQTEGPVQPQLLATVGEYDYVGMVFSNISEGDNIFLDYYNNRNGALYFSSI